MRLDVVLVVLCICISLALYHAQGDGLVVVEEDGTTVSVEEVEAPPEPHDIVVEEKEEQQGGEVQEELINPETLVAPSEGEHSPFVELFGESLYRWDDEVTANGERNILEYPTDQILKDKKVVGIYFSASWCGPCQKFTPQLAKFYHEMNKAGKKYEIVWVSRDRTQEEFVQYYSKMPWLAVPIGNLQKVIEVLGPKYQMKGIPHLVILDGQDASVYTLDGRRMMMEDSYGLQFPWAPRTLMNMLPRPLRAIIKQQMMSIKKFLRGVLEGFLPQQVVKMIMKE
jgi:thiol-disulfide isomerase/thioredoxin